MPDWDKRIKASILVYERQLALLESLHVLLLTFLLRFQKSWREAGTTFEARPRRSLLLRKSPESPFIEAESSANLVLGLGPGLIGPKISPNRFQPIRMLEI